MSAIIVWNNGEPYDGNATHCIAVDAGDIDDVVRLVALDWQGQIEAMAISAEWRSPPMTLDEWLRSRVFNVCLPLHEDDRVRNHAALMQLPRPLRERVATALLDARDTYHESHGEAVAALVARLRT